MKHCFPCAHRSVKDVFLAFRGLVPARRTDRREHSGGGISHLSAGSLPLGRSWTSCFTWRRERAALNMRVLPPRHPMPYRLGHYLSSPKEGGRRSTALGPGEF